MAAALVFVAPAASAAPGDTVSGTVFQDFNSNGIMDDAAGNTGLGGVGVNDIGVAGVTVTAYDDAGVVVGTATTGADGVYSIDAATLATGAPLRIQFDTPTGFFPAVHGPAPSAAQVNNGTSVQFTTVGSTMPVNYGVADPNDVSVENPPIMSTMNSQGGWGTPANADKTAWVIQPYESGNSRGGPVPNQPANGYSVLATYSEVGSVWSTVFSQATTSGYAAASLRRDSAMGPMGLGGIYRVGNLVGKDGHLNAGHDAATQWLDVTDLGIDIGQGVVDSNADRGVDTVGNAADANAYEWAGRAGIGGIAVDKAGTTMFVANLYDNNVYALALDPNDPSAAPTSYTLIGTPVAAGQQISAVAVHDERLYVGYVDTTVDGGTLTSPKQSAADAGLQAHVASTPVAAPGAWAASLDFSLGYTKPTVEVGMSAGAAQWNTWSNTYDVCTVSCGTDPYNYAPSQSGGRSVYTQAMLSDIAFDSQGFMAVSLGDRWELQVGNGFPTSPCVEPGGIPSGYTACTLNGNPDASVYVTSPIASGQTLVAAPQSDGSYLLENNGALTVDGTAVRTRDASLPFNETAHRGTGPGGMGFLESHATGWSSHYASALGGVTTVPGGAQVVNTTMDPNGINSSGLNWLNLTNGTANGSYYHTAEFAKGGAIGGVTSVITPPGIEIGNRVWLDRNGNGLQDADTVREPAIAGAVVQLLDAEGGVLATTTTDANGNYYFHSDDVDGFDPNGGDYQIAFINPSTLASTDPNYADPTDQAVPAYVVDGETIAPAITWGQLALTGPAVGDDTAIDSNAVADGTNPQNGVATYTAGPPGANDHTVDAGFAVPVSIGDYLWIDANNNGVQDDGEEPVANVVVTLLDANGDPVATTETDANGFYVFTGLPPNTDFTVQFPTEVNVGGIDYVLIAPDQGGDDTIDSNPDQQTGLAPVTTPPAGNNSGDPGQADDPTIDAGYFPKPVSIGDYVWIDQNGNGVQDPGEVPVPNVPVTLLAADGVTVVATTQTDADGYYAFTGLVPDTDYIVQFPTTVTTPDGDTYVLTDPALGGNDAADSNPDPLTGNAPVRTPLQGNNSGEPGEADVPTIDAGYKPLVSIGDYVWIDANGDGIQDDGEEPVSEVTVTLLAADGVTVIATTQTDASGYYYFADLPADTEYIVQFPTEVTVGGIEYALTLPAQGGDDANDSNPDQLTGNAPVTTPSAGNNLATPGDADDPTVDAGYTRKPVSIGDYVWIDADGDGVQDAGESPVPGATITLLDAEGNPVATTQTDENGYYAFTDLPADTDFTVQFPTTVTVDGIGYALTQPTRGGDSAADSNPDPQTGRAPVTTPSGGDNLGTPGDADDPTIDAGYFPLPVSIGDYVWIDADGDGVQDAGESPVPGATITLLDAEGNPVATTQTDENGYYAFTDLTPNTEYTVQFPTTVTVDGIDYALTQPTRGGDRAADSNPDPQTGLVSVVTPRSGNNSGEPGKADDPTIDAGYFPHPVSIGDYVWIDSDGDGVQDGGESPVAGATITLLDADGNVVATTETDENGYYAFTNLTPDTNYTVRFPTEVTVDGIAYELTQPTRGRDAAADSNPDRATGDAPVRTPMSGNNSGEPGMADDPTIDAGYSPKLVSIGDYIWIDTDGNGVQDDGEPAVPGITVTLVDADGNVVSTTTTDENGFYAFTDLRPDTTYGVKFPTTVTIDGKEYRLTAAGRGGEQGLDSNPDQTSGIAWVTTPKMGNNSGEPGMADDPTIDAGYVIVPNQMLPQTGVDPAGLLTGALVLLLAGAALLIASRRRSQYSAM